jgi:hypothetical protein
MIGTRIGGFTVLSIDPMQRRCSVSCVCGAVHVYSCEAVRDGTAECPALPLSRQQRNARLAINEAREFRRRWRG